MPSRDDDPWIENHWKLPQVRDQLEHLIIDRNRF
jgi:hypothetical protein